MSDAELARLVRDLTPGELAAVVALIHALAAPPPRTLPELRASVVLAMSTAPAAHLGALAAVAEALAASR